MPIPKWEQTDGRKTFDGTALTLWRKGGEFSLDVENDDHLIEVYFKDLDALREVETWLHEAILRVSSEGPDNGP